MTAVTVPPVMRAFARVVTLPRNFWVAVHPRAALHVARAVELEADALVGRVLELFGVLQQGVEHRVDGIFVDDGQVEALGGVFRERTDGHLGDVGRRPAVRQGVRPLGQVVRLQAQDPVRGVRWVMRRRPAEVSRARAGVPFTVRPRRASPLCRESACSASAWDSRAASRAGGGRLSRTSPGGRRLRDSPPSRRRASRAAGLAALGGTAGSRVHPPARELPAPDAQDVLVVAPDAGTRPAELAPGRRDGDVPLRDPGGRRVPVAQPGRLPAGRRRPPRTASGTSVPPRRQRAGPGERPPQTSSPATSARARP